LEIARGLEHIHNLNVVHGNLKIVSPFPNPHSGRPLTFAQTNILVDARRRACIAGLGTALLPSVDRFFNGTAPELVDPRRFGLTDIGTTKASDTYAFGVLAWEVSTTFSARAKY